MTHQKMLSTSAKLVLAGLMVIGASACSKTMSEFQEGAYVNTAEGTTYEFLADGQGILSSGVAGQPEFTYTVEGTEVITKGGVSLVFTRIDDQTLERNIDGTLITLNE